MSHEMPHELSESQPPAWEDKPQIPSAQVNPEIVQPPRQTKSLDFGGILGRIWEVLISDWRKHFLQAFLTAAVFSVLAIGLVSIGVQNLSAEAWAVLNGQAPQISDQPTAAELEALIGVLLEVFSLVAWLLPALLLAQLLISGFSTKLALSHPYYDQNIQRIPWLKLLTSNLLVTIILTLTFAPMMVAFVTNQITLGLLLLLISIVFAIWFGIGILLLAPVVIHRNIGGIEAVRATLMIAKGRRLMIVGVSLLIGILGSLLASTITQLVSLLPGTSEALWYFVVSNFIPLALSLPLSAIAATVLYMNYKTND